MSAWSLQKLLAALHDDIEHRLATARTSLDHPGTKGEASERIWLELLQTYLPARYHAEKAHVVDSTGAFSEQIDVLIFDRQYSPFIFQFEGQIIVPAESVYAAFEAKQVINAEKINYAQSKVASVRRLLRTSEPIPYAGGTYPAKTPADILGGILALESDWRPALGEPLLSSLSANPEQRLDLGCVAAHGVFSWDVSGRHVLIPQGKASTVFLLELIARLQGLATAPMIDVRAYARFLTSEAR